MAKPQVVTEVEDDFLLQVARIMGSSSAAEAALKERDRRRNLGEDAVIYWNRDRGILFVGPPIVEAEVPPPGM